MMQMITVYRSA